MVWFRVDDVLPFHARVLEAGNAAMGLWVRAGALSAGQLTDGFITTATAKQLGSPREIKRLVEVGLWLQVDGGYQFHAWAEDGTGAKRQPTRAEVEAQRKAERDRKAAYRESLKDGRKPSGTTPHGRPKGVPAGQPEGHPADVPEESQQASGHPDPTRPDQVPSDEGTSLSPDKPAATRKRRIPIPDDFAPNDSNRAFAAEHHLDLQAELDAFRNHALMNGRLGLDWNAGFRNWLAKAAQIAQQRRPDQAKQTKDDRARATIQLGIDLAAEQDTFTGGDFLQLRAIS